MHRYLIGSCLFVLAGIASACSSRHFEVINSGIGGNATNDLIARLDRDVLSRAPDLIVVMVGTNDMINSRKLSTFQVFASNYRTLIEKIRMSGASLVLVSPPPADTASLYERHDRMAFPEPPAVRLDSANRIIGRLARQYALPHLDLYNLFRDAGEPRRDHRSMLVNTHNLGKRDGVHPTAEGYAFIARALYELLRENRLLKKRMRIICFGDSMTYGAFMEGAGTADGETYPAVLKRLLERSSSNDNR